MSIDFHEQEPIRPEPYQELDMRVDKSEEKDTWNLSFSTSDELERIAYEKAIDITIKLNAFHLERAQGRDIAEQRWEISGVPEGVEKEDFDSIIKDIQNRANSNLRTPLAA